MTASAASYILRAPSKGIQATPTATTPAASNDPYYSDVVLLMHMDGNYTDAQGITFNAGSGASMSTTNKFGTGSTKFSGTADGLRSSASVSATNMQNQPFTAEAWVNFSSLSGANSRLYRESGSDRIST